MLRLPAIEPKLKPIAPPVPGPAGAGNPQAGFPRVSGQHAAYAVDQLKQFSQGARANDMAAMMRTVSAKMSEAEMQAVAEYMQGLR